MKKYIDTLMLSLILFCTLPVMPEYNVSGQSIQNTVPAPCASEYSAIVYADVNEPSDHDRHDQDIKTEACSLPEDKNGHSRH
jgi:hypothetical protein